MNAKHNPFEGHNVRVEVEQGHHRSPRGHFFSVCTCGSAVGPFESTDEARRAAH